MENFKANLQNFDNRLDFHWVSLVPTVFRRVFRSIGVGFLPLEKFPGGFCFQVTFRVRFPKPPWNLFYIQILPGIAFLCLNDVTKKSDNIWRQSNCPTIMIQLKSDVIFVIICNTLFLRLILMVSIPFREQVVSSNNFLSRQRHFLWRLRQFDQSDRTTIPVGLDFLNFKTRKTTLIQSWVLRFLVMDKTYIEEFVEIGVIIDLIVTLVFTWRIVIRRFVMFGIFPCGFQTHRNKMRWDLLTVRQMLRGLRERFIRGDLYHNLGIQYFGGMSTQRADEVFGTMVGYLRV